MDNVNKAHHLRIPVQLLPQSNLRKMNASAGNRTRVNCLEGSYAHHYTTDALLQNEK